MLKTITVGSCVSIQGTYVKTLPDGKIAVRDGDTLYTGYPVAKAA